MPMTRPEGGDYWETPDVKMMYNTKPCLCSSDWRPNNLPDTYEPFKRGEFEYCFADTHNSTTGNYGGAFIGPQMIAANIYTLIDRKGNRR